MRAIHREEGGFLVPDAVDEAREGAAPALLALPGAHAVSIGLKERGGRAVEPPELAVRVYVTRKVPLEELGPGAAVPAEVDGVQTDVVEAPVFRPSADYDAGAAARRRPLVGGTMVSTCRGPGYWGTGGLVLYDAGPDSAPLLISCAHILCLQDGAQQVGDQIVQPALLAGGTCPADVVATLESWVLPSDHGTDVAAARLVAGVRGVPSQLMLPPPQRVASFFLGEGAVKYGAKTGRTLGVVVGVNASLAVGYESGTVTIDGVTIVAPVAPFTAFSGAGDSGAMASAYSGDTTTSFRAGLVFAASGVNSALLGLSGALAALGLPAYPAFGSSYASRGEGAVLASGQARLGVSRQGFLGTYSSPVTGSPALVTLSYAPASGPALQLVQDGRDSWGVYAAPGPPTPWADPSGRSAWAGAGVGSLGYWVEDFQHSDSRVLCVARVGDLLRVSHDFGPTRPDGLFRCVVTVVNLSGAALPEVRYRRYTQLSSGSLSLNYDGWGDGLLLDAAPSAGRSADPAIPISHIGAPTVVDEDGAGNSAPRPSEYPNHLAADGQPDWLDSYGDGYASSGFACFDLRLGSIAAGSSARLAVYYGAFATRALALAAVSAAGASGWAISSPRDDPYGGTPATPVFAVGRAGGSGWSVGRV